jgi:hypothetical protein
MSLDVSLITGTRTEKCMCPTCDDYHDRVIEDVAFDANITHNLNKMAQEAGIYQHVWRPEELGITQAKDLIEPLRAAIADMQARPKHYEQFNASNGWGLYRNFVPWLKRYLAACEEYPEATIYVSR